MRAVGLKVLKNKLSEYVRLAAEGETVLVTDRERVVAELVPPREGRPAALDEARMAELIRRGLLAPASSRSTEPLPRKPVMRWAELERAIAEGREDPGDPGDP